LAARLGIGKDEIQHEVESTRRNVQERMETFGGDNPDRAIEGKDAVITDDGLAAGYTMRAAIEAIQDLSPARIVVAVPTAPLSAVSRIARMVDLVVCLNIRSGPFFAVADAYVEWHDLTEDEVLQYLSGARDRGLMRAEATG
ncbi:MAG TPA: phosphoribosyltransferase family protein, partial [Methanomicrobiales archaeon]|nr:phosphoribosyltransferase family protein [Methanomicrobiales archaeon]